MDTRPLAGKRKKPCRRWSVTEAVQDPSRVGAEGGNESRRSTVAASASLQMKKMSNRSSGLELRK